jgi:hypothetical protein
MSNTSITYLVIACSSVFGLAIFVWLVLVPAWKSYPTLWQRAAATFLAFYVLATLVGIGVLLGAALFFYSDQLNF